MRASHSKAIPELNISCVSFEAITFHLLSAKTHGYFIMQNAFGPTSKFFFVFKNSALLKNTSSHARRIWGMCRSRPDGLLRMTRPGHVGLGVFDILPALSLC